MKPDSVDSDLRQRAEEKLNGSDHLPLSALDAERLLHELQVHQIELEMQNDELSSSHFELQKQKDRYFDFYDFSPTAFVSLDGDGIIIQINLAGASLLGEERAKLVGSHFIQFVASDDRSGFNLFLQHSCPSSGKQTCELKLTTKKSARLNVQIEAALSPDGQELRMVVMDLTESKQAEKRLHLAASVFNNAREGIWIAGTDFKIIEVNDAFRRITGYDRTESLGQSPCFYRSEQPPQVDLEDILGNLQDFGHWRGEVWNRRKDGAIYAEMLNISVVRDPTGRVLNYVAMLTDITLQKKHQKQLEYIAHFDALTKIPNRLLLVDRLQHAIVQSQRHEKSLAVLYIDLDGFKAVNDQHGHVVGDKLLVTIAQRLKSIMREGDTLARLGGDEFVAVLVDLESPHDCKQALSRLLQAASAPIEADSLVLRVSASIGVALYPQAGLDVDQLLRNADQAMYVAKQEGKNRYHVFDHAQDAAAKIRYETVEFISNALKSHEFKLYYQPKVNMTTGTLVGVEALIRWQHPEKGLLEPDAFLPLIEGHAISTDLGEWVIDTAMTQISEWLDAGLQIPVSVNLSPQQLQHGDFVARLKALLGNHPNIKPSLLELEILETSALENIELIYEIMQECCSFGVSFTLDDFGTGYSSLTHLKRLPIKQIKIDRVFVRGMLDDPDDLAIVKGVIGLAKAFNIDVIAEGVETVPHGDRLLPMGCTLAQGFGIGLPMPGSELIPWVDNWCPSLSWHG